MKFKARILVTILAFIVFAHHADAAVTTRPGPNTGLIGYWNFNEGVGTIAHDFSGNLNTGALTNIPTWTTGKLGKALSFSRASSQYVTIPNSSSLAIATGDMTISVWFYANSYLGYTTLFKKGNDPNRDYAFYINTPTDGYLAMGNEGGNVVSFTNPITLNVWHHLIITKSGTAATGYIDGVQSFTKTVSANADSGSPLEIGKPDGANSYWDGKIDEFRIYNRAFSATEAYTLYRTTGTTYKFPSRNGAVGYWSLDDNSSTRAHDFSGLGQNGTLAGASGGVPTWVAGKRARALHFDGVDDEVDISRTTALNLTNNATISAWVKPDTSNDGDIFQSGLGTADAMTIWMAGSQGNQIWFGRQQGDTPDWAISSTLFVPGQWIHITGVINAGVETIYINGIAEGSSSNNGTFTNGVTYLMGSGDDGHFQGIIDDMRIYNRPLSAAEVLANYRAGQVVINGNQNSKLTSGLVGLWSFNGADMTSTTALDRSGSGNTGTFTNGPTPTIGRIGQALYFDNSAYVNAGNDTSLQLSTGTIGAWIKTPDAGVGYRAIVVKQFAYSLFLLSNNLTVYDWSGGGAIDTGINLADDKWHYVAATFDSGVTNGTKIYIDGELRYTSTMTIFGQSVSLKIGNEPNSNQNFIGKIDEARVYNRQLSDAEVKQLYLMGK